MSATVGPDATAPHPDLRKTRPLVDHRESTLLICCAAATLGLLAVNASGSVVIRAMFHSGSAPVDDFARYLPVLLPLLGLALWLAAPRRAPAILMLAGVVCMAPAVVFAVTSTAVPSQIVDTLVILGFGGPSLLMIGVLAAATIGWRAGRRLPAVGLIGATVMIAPVGQVLLATSRDGGPLGSAPHGVLDAVTVVFGVLAAAGALIAAVRPAPRIDVESGQRPAPMMVAAAAIGLLVSMVVPTVWQPSSIAEVTGRSGGYLPWLTLIMLAAGLVAGAMCGPRLLAVAAAIGLLLGGFRVLTTPLLTAFQDLPALTIVGAVLGLLIGTAVALSSRGHRSGPPLLALVGVGVLVLFWMLDDGKAFDEHRDLVIGGTAVLLVLAVIGGIVTAGAVGELTARPLATPMVLVGVVAPIAAAVANGGQLLTVRMHDRPPVDAALLPAGIALLLAAGLAAWLLAARAGAGRVAASNTDVDATLPDPSTTSSIPGMVRE